MSWCPLPIACLLVNHANATNTETTLRDVQSAASAMGLQNPGPQSRHQRRDQCGLRNVCCRGSGPTPSLSASTPFFGSRRVQIVHLASYHRLPATYGKQRHCEIGGHISYGTTLLIKSTDGRLCRSHPQGREARGPAGGAGDQVRAGHQPRDRQDARPRRTGHAARTADEVIE